MVGLVGLALAVEAERAAAATARRADLEARPRVRFLGQPGATENDRERYEQRAIDDHLVGQAAAADAAARAAYARHLRSAF